SLAKYRLPSLEKTCRTLTMHKLFRRCQLRNRAIVRPTRQPIRTPVSDAFENKSSRRRPFARSDTCRSAGVFRNTQRPDRSLLKEGYCYSSRMQLIVSSEPFE